MGTKGTINIDLLHLESVRDGLTKCRCAYRLRAYQVTYISLFGACEDIYGRVTSRLMCGLIITGIGQMDRLLKRLTDSGLLIKHVPEGGKRGIYYTLSELGRSVRALYLATYRSRYDRLCKHIAKHSGE